MVNFAWSPPVLLISFVILGFLMLQEILEAVSSVGVVEGVVSGQPLTNYLCNASHNLMYVPRNVNRKKSSS